MARTKKPTADHQLLLALACGASVENAARQCGLSESTARRRLKTPEFAKELQEIRAGMVERTSATLTAVGAEAVKALVSLLAATTPPPVRLGAARTVLELGIRFRENADFGPRLAALEEVMRDQQTMP